MASNCEKCSGQKKREENSTGNVAHFETPGFAGRRLDRGGPYPNRTRDSKLWATEMSARLRQAHPRCESALDVIRRRTRNVLPADENLMAKPVVRFMVHGPTNILAGCRMAVTTRAGVVQRPGYGGEFVKDYSPLTNQRAGPRGDSLRNRNDPNPLRHLSSWRFETLQNRLRPWEPLKKYI
jgi:hypothetical protein